MAHSASMGPPLSPRETRRSVRRTAPSISASTSKSPDSDQPPPPPPPREKQRTTSSSSRNKRLKQEDYDDPPEESKNPPTSSVISSGSNSGNPTKPKRRGKEKEKSDKDKDKQGTLTNNNDGDSASVDLAPQEYNDEDDQGITRCVCGSTEDDPDAGEFMVQCETCKVWQHGLCMGYLSEDQVHDDDYYCEECRPDLHVDLFKKLSKRSARQTSTTSRSENPTNTRVSRSHSPSHLSKQASKRRNTMNSRDAAFDESLKEIIEATAAEAAAVQDTDQPSHPAETDPLKKKRKRSAEDLPSKKRTRSASTASDRQSVAPPSTEAPALPAPPKPSIAKPKRGGGGSSRKTTGNEALPAESDEAVTASNKRQNNNSRPKAPAAPKRPPLSHSISHGSAPVTQEHTLKRNQASGHTSTAADARAYRNTHAYAVSQQTLFTSWNLPDYLSHLEHILPTEVPQPLEVRSSIATSNSNTRADSIDRTMERGVKVKWPAKRMSVGDMNKRVRALVEWVGREQANALDRGRRRQALEVALRDQVQLGDNDGSSDVAAMEVDQPGEQQRPAPSKTTPQLFPSLEMSTQTMKMMEELMEELIGFQEKFGPGAKSRDRRVNTNS